MPPEQVEGAFDLGDLGFDICAHGTSLVLPGCALKARNGRGFKEIAAPTQDAALFPASKTH
jgi:hypothetical protein